MDWIERIFGIAPDAGSGVLEAAVAATLALVAGALAYAAGTRRVKPR